jgi:PAS domain S-box-containing protein
MGNVSTDLFLLVMHLRVFVLTCVYLFVSWKPLLRERLTLMQQVQQLGAISNPAIGQVSLLQKEASISSVAAGMYPMAAQKAIAFPQQMLLGVQQGFPNHQGCTLPLNPPEQEPPQTAVNGINHNDYKFVFNNSSVGLAIASLGGAFIDCNSIFCHLSEYTKEEVCAMTIFNMTSRQDLQHAFDLISQMITPILDGIEREEKSSIVLRGAMKNRHDLGLSISLIKGDHGIAKCFSVTLVRVLSNESARQDTTVSVEMESPQISSKQQLNVGFGASPAYTAG